MGRRQHYHHQRRSISSIPNNNDNTDIMIKELKEMNDKLRVENEYLRSADKAEILKSWAEVELLQDEKEEITEQNIQLIAELEASKMREELLRKQLEKFYTAMEQQQKKRQSEGRTSVTPEEVVTVDTTSYLSYFFSGYQPPGEEEDSIEEVKNDCKEKEEQIIILQSQLHCSERALDTMKKMGQIQDTNLKKLRSKFSKRSKVTQDREEKFKSIIMNLKSIVEEKDQFIDRKDREIENYRKKEYIYYQDKLINHHNVEEEKKEDSLIFFDDDDLSSF